MTQRLNRRTVLTGTTVLGASLVLPAIPHAQSKSLVAATFPGTWSEADRNIILPAFKSATGASVTQSIVRPGSTPHRREGQ
jgi:putative spermidine/putrescine transport system substrate-binding protein